MFFYHPSYFVAIVQAGNLTKAAEQLYVSQPSLSQYLKRLESNLGVELFDHSTSPLRLTYIGERYYQYVQQVMQLDDDVRREFQDIKSQTSGKLRLGIALWRGACILPVVFPEFHRRYPGIRLELLEGRSSLLESALMTNKIDLAIMNLPHTLDYGKLTCETIFEERIFLAAPTKHPYVQKLLAAQPDCQGNPVTSLDMVRQIPLILTKAGQNLTHEVRYALGKNQIEPEILLETGNLTTAINLVSTGIACAFVPEGGAKVCLHPGEVTYFAVDIPELKWPLAAVYRKDVYLPQLSKLFIEAFKQSAGASPGPL